MSNLRGHPLEPIWNDGSAREGRVKRVYIVAGGRKPKGKAAQPHLPPPPGFDTRADYTAEQSEFLRLILALKTQRGPRVTERYAVRHAIAAGYRKVAKPYMPHRPPKESHGWGACQSSLTSDAWIF